MKRSPLRARSAKRTAQYAGPTGRRALVAKLLGERPACQAAIHGTCTGTPQDVHELLARSAGGSILDESNCVVVCRRCHDWIGNHPTEALARGLRKSRYAGRNP